MNIDNYGIGCCFREQNETILECVSASLISKKISSVFNSVEHGISSFTHRVKKTFIHLGEQVSSLVIKIYRYVCNKLFPKPPSMEQLDLAIKEMQDVDVQNINVGEWTSHNDVLVTASAKETNAWKLDLIKAAKHSIEISGSICGGTVFRQALTAIQKRLEAEVKDLGQPHLQVRILTTPDLLENEDKVLLQTLARQYPNHFHYLVSTFKYKEMYRVENHVKLMIVDEKYYIIGGTNCQDRLSAEANPINKPQGLDHVLGSGSVDMDVVGRGRSMASVMRREFFKLYSLLEHKENPKTSQLLNNYYFNVPKEGTEINHFNRHIKVERDVKVKAMTGSSETPVNGCTQEYANLIQKATKQVTVAQMYFDPPELIKQSIDQLQERKIPIYVITAGTKAKAPKANQFYAYANANYFMGLLEKNKHNRVYLYEKDNNIYHKKVAVSERVSEGLHKKEDLVAIGSYNWGGKSHMDHEMIVVIKSDKVAQKVLDILRKDISKSRKVTQQEVENHKKNILRGAIGIVQHHIFPVLVG